MLLNGGKLFRFDAYVPATLLEYEISDEIWQQAIDDFNKKLNARPSVTTEINGVKVDVLKLESVVESAEYVRIGAVILQIIGKEEEIKEIADIHFCLTGSLTFTGVGGKVDGMVIKNITYGGEDSKMFGILNDSIK